MKHNSGYKKLLSSTFILSSLTLVACGGGGGSSSSSGGEGAASLCQNAVSGVNWEALLTENCPKLSSYNLFADATDPTKSANGGGIPYDLSTPLFTDYASKYRIVFLPEGTQAIYNENEAFEFPVGTVISKTFAMPEDTAFRGVNETLIETRLLIHRESGWAALPYAWNSEKTDADLAIAGKNLAMTVTHNGAQYSFTYGIPDTNKCKQCHQFKADEVSASVFVPIGPKARHLNIDYNYGAVTANQLTYWQQLGVLSGLPADLNSIPSIPAYRDGDESGLASQSNEVLMDLAKGYLDSNCAHCHRPEGNASNTGLFLEYWRSYSTNQEKHGVCKKPVAYGGGDLEYDVVPGDPESSILHFRMSSNEPGDRMPEIGRGLTHTEGVALISEWISRLDAAACSSQ